MQLLPWLTVFDRANCRTVPLVDNCLTLAATDLNPLWDTASTLCEDCCPPCMNDETYTGDVATDQPWWYDGSAGSLKAIGFLADEVDLEPTTSIRRLGETSDDAPAYTPRQLTITGRLLADSREGIYHLQTKFTEALQASCSPCDGFEIGILPFCPDETPDQQPDIVLTWQPADELETVDPESCYSTPCPPAEPLPPSVASTERTDTGRRDLLRGRFQYFDVDPESELVANCWQAEVIIGFEIFEDYEWGELVSTQTAGRVLVGPDRWPHNWGQCLWFPDLEECEAGPATEGQVDTESIRPIVARTSQYRQPMETNRRSFISPILQAGDNVAPVIRIDVGDKPLVNFRLDVHPAFDNFPAPETCAGWEFYSNHARCAVLAIPGPLPERSSLVIDGRGQRVLLYCDNQAGVRAEDQIENWPWPTLDPSCRYWFTAVVDSYQTSELASLDIQLSPRFLT